MRIPPYHWWRTVFYLIPAISVYTVVLGAASIASSRLVFSIGVILPLGLNSGLTSSAASFATRAASAVAGACR